MKQCKSQVFVERKSGGESRRMPMDLFSNAPSVRKMGEGREQRRQAERQREILELGMCEEFDHG